MLQHATTSLVSASRHSSALFAAGSAVVGAVVGGLVGSLPGFVLGAKAGIALAAGATAVGGAAGYRFGREVQNQLDDKADVIAVAAPAHVHSSSSLSSSSHTSSALSWASCTSCTSCFFVVVVVGCTVFHCPSYVEFCPFIRFYHQSLELSLPLCSQHLSILWQWQQHQRQRTPILLPSSCRAYTFSTNILLARNGMFNQLTSRAVSTPCPSVETAFLKYWHIINVLTVYKIWHSHY